ncbi:MAG: T9SS type A sorting domain-containing protein [Bacteroidales bacterium]
MNKNKTSISFFLLVIALLFTSISKAQFTFSPSTTIVNYQILNELSYDSIHIANNSADTLKMKWELLEYDTVGGSYFDFCSTGNCWLAIPASGSFPPIKPGGFGYAGVHLWTGNVVADCSARIWVYKEGNYTAGDTLTYILHAIKGNGIENNNESDNSITVYPNPVSDKVIISLSFNLSEEASLTINNILGEIIFSKTGLTTFTEISLDNISEGLYFLNVISKNKKYVRKIVVSR